MRSVIVDENDERLVSLRNEADAKAFRIFQWVLLMAYFGYTLIVPTDIFESVGWWLTMVLLFTSYALQAVLSRSIDAESAIGQNDEEK